MHDGRHSRRALQVTAALLCGALSSGCIYARVMYYNIPNLETAESFDSRAVPASPHPLPLEERLAEIAVPPMPGKHYASLEALLAANQTRAFLVVHDDAIVYERYFGHVSATTRIPSFSISKTYAALLVGMAERDGLLGSLDQSIVDYVPELAHKSRYDAVTLDELLRMTSGIDYVEESVDGAKFYYGTDLRKRMYDYDVKWTPGTHYEYGSVNIQLLWDAIHRQLGGKTVSDYFASTVWGPIGAERPAEYSLDSKESGIEKFFGGFNATARDHARIGLLYLHGGVAGGAQVVPKEWVDASLTLDPVAGVIKTHDGNVRRTRYQWFATMDGRAYFAKGYHGQYILVVPDHKTVFVRFGEGYGDVDWPVLFEKIADELGP